MTTKPSLSLMPFFTSLIILVILFQFHSRTPNPDVDTRTSLLLPRPRDSIAFLPLKDNRLRDTPADGNTWFMSSVNDTEASDVPRHIYFPSASTEGRLLCLSAHHRTNGTKNFYALARPNALPADATLLRGLTVVCDTRYEYINIWHGLSAVAPFFAWRQRNECVRPERWVLFHWGELRTVMGNWVRTVAELATGHEVKIEDLERFQKVGPVCFERAVVFRSEYGKLSSERRAEVFDAVRRKARGYCKVPASVSSTKKIRATMLFRVGARAFKNEAAVTEIFDRECRKVDGCVLRVAHVNNLTFCDQVKLFSETDILMTAHGAQMTNMIFMDKNSSVMEFFPKGWLEHAGVGQYVFWWLGKWAGMRHQGQWKDQEGEDCPYDNHSSCFRLYKGGSIGHNESYFGTWMAKVLVEAKQYKSSAGMRPVDQSDCLCSCSSSRTTGDRVS